MALLVNKNIPQPQETTIYLTELQGLKVFDLDWRLIGNIRDVVLVPRVHNVRVDRFLLGTNEPFLSFRFDQIGSISLEGIHLKDESLHPLREGENYWRLARDLLDKQIVDIHGRKVVRVSDVTFSIVDNNQLSELHIVEIDIGVRSIIRRVLQGILSPTLIRKVQAPIKPKSIPWEYCNVIEPDPLRRLHLNTSYRRLEQIHPADLAAIVEDLGPAEREAIMETIDTEVAADALSELSPETRANIMESLETERAAEIVEEMEPDEAADTLADLEDSTSEQILAEMESEPKLELEQLLEFSPHTAGGLMTTKFLLLSEDDLVSTAIAEIKADPDLARHPGVVFVQNRNGKLSGEISLIELFIHDGETHLNKLNTEELISVPSDEHEDRVVEIFDKYSLFTLPVVDEQKCLLGVITADDVISLIRS